VGGREWRVAVVIVAFMAAVTGSEGGGNYGRLKRWVIGGQPMRAPWRGRRRGRRPWQDGVRGGGGSARLAW
jgi:hypothetical protein